MKLLTTLPVLLLLILILTLNSYSQIVEPTGSSDEASSQLIYWYDEGQNITMGPPGAQFDTSIQVTNTNDTEGVWIHVQIFRSFDVSGFVTDENNEKVICEERNFVDFLTPNDTHVYDLDNSPNDFTKNIGEAENTDGEQVNIDLFDTKGFIVITPIVSESDFTAISFQYLIGHSMISVNPGPDPTDVCYKLNAMGRDAMDFSTGEKTADLIPLDGVTNGFVLLQPQELLFDFFHQNTTAKVQVVGIAFEDSYGPAGLLGYQVIPASATWTPFIFDFKEDLTSCGVKQLDCFDDLGLNDNYFQTNLLLGEEILCAGAETPLVGTSSDTAGWTRIFISDFGNFSNILGIFANTTRSGASWMFTNK